MAFGHKVFADGEWTYNTPQWKENLEKLEQDIKSVNFREDNKRFLSTEVGFIHPENGSYFRIMDNGDIEMFTGYGTGIRISANNTIQMFADRIQHISKEFDVQTSANNKIEHSEYASYPKDKGLSLDTIERLEKTGINTYNSKEWK